jgi:hypothetical protein
MAVMTIQLKGGTAAALTAANPTLAARELCVETDTGKGKVGNGTDAWNDLDYAFEGALSGVTVIDGGEIVYPS